MKKSIHQLIAETPEPPYFAVIFSSVMTGDTIGYSEMADNMLVLAQEQEGFLGYESARNEMGITVSYWKDLEAIHKWKINQDHWIAKQQGKEKWYARFKTRIAKVEKAY